MFTLTHDHYLGYYNVPVDGFMLGSIAVELLRSGERISDGPCSTLEIIASSSNVTIDDIWATEGGKLCSCVGVAREELTLILSNVFHYF